MRLPPTEWTQVTDTKQQTSPDQARSAARHVHLGLEFRHLRYLVAVADAGTFTEAARRMYVSQPTLSEQIRRLEEMVGTPLLQRRRDGVQVTSAGSVLLAESRAMLSQLEHGVSRSRQAAGLGRPRLRFVLPPGMPDELAIEAASRLRSAALAADADVTWIEAPMGADFSLIRQRRADAGLGWLTSEPTDHQLEVMSVGEFEPEAWLPVATMADRDVIGMRDLAEMEVVYGPHAAGTGIHDAWLAVLRSGNEWFEFTDPPVRHSLLMTLAFAAIADRPAAVLTGPRHPARNSPLPGLRKHVAGTEMIRTSIAGRPLTASAVVAWNADLPRHLQQILFDAADSITDASAVPSGTGGLLSLVPSSRVRSAELRSRRGGRWPGRRCAYH